METAPQYTIINYDLLANSGGAAIYINEEVELPLSKEIKVTADLGRAKTKTKYWVSEPDKNGNYGQPTTALFDIGQLRWYYGDLESKNHFLIFEYRQDKKVLRIYYFKDFYPKNSRRFTKNFIKQ